MPWTLCVLCQPLLRVRLCVQSLPASTLGTGALRVVDVGEAGVTTPTIDYP
jgi:hypothetical protein